MLNVTIMFYILFTVLDSAIKGKYERIKQIINEFLLLLLNYQMFLLTDYVDPSHYTIIGNSVILVIILSVILNLLVTVWDLLP